MSGLNATGAELNAVADVSAITIDTSTAIANNDGIAVFDSSASSIGYFDVDLLDTYFAGTTKTLTNKTLTSPTVSGLYLSDAGFIVEGSSADGNESTVTFTDPTADRTITFPDATGTVALSGATQNVDFGTITSDGLTVESGGNALSSTGNNIQFNRAAGSSFIDQIGASGSLLFRTTASQTSRLKIDNNGDISFYDSAGSSQSFYWDANEESLGIGTTSPSRSLHISGGTNSMVIERTDATTSALLLVAESNNTAIYSRASNASTTARDLIFNMGSTEAMRIDSSGNVGIGCVPNSIQSGFDTLQIGGNLTLNVDSTGVGAGVYMGNNVYRDSVNSRWEYINTDEATQYLQANGEHIWRYAASGTADTAITWSESMRIDSSGRVKLHEDLVQDEVKATTTATTQVAIDTFPHASYDGAKAVITAATSADTYVTELLIATNGTTAVATEYGQIGTGSALATYDVDISGSDVRILATPASTTSTTFRVAMTVT